VFCDSYSDAKDAVAKLYARLSSTLNHLDVVARTRYRAVKRKCTERTQVLSHSQVHVSLFYAINSTHSHTVLVLLL
jgi:hypothetical protein